MLEAVLRAVGTTLDAGFAELMALGATVPGLAILLPLIGLTGAAIASLVAYAISMTWMSRRVSRALALPIPRLFVIERADARWLHRGAWPSLARRLAASRGAAIMRAHGLGGTGQRLRLGAARGSGCAGQVLRPRGIVHSRAGA